MKNISELRVLFKRGRVVRKVFKLAVSKTDASLYIFPYSRRGVYYYGTKQLPEHHVPITFDFTQDRYSERIPKLSIHESGQVHIKSQDILAGPLQTQSLSNYRGEHLATICPDAISALPLLIHPIKQSGTKVDKVISVGARTNSARIVLYASGDKPAFSVPDCQIVVSMMRPTLTVPIHIGMKIYPQSPLGLDKQEGITVIAGFNPKLTDNDNPEFLYIRCL